MTGDQSNPKSIIEWSDVEDESRKLDPYSLKVRKSSFHFISHVSAEYNVFYSLSSPITIVISAGTRRSLENGNSPFQETCFDG